MPTVSTCNNTNFDTKLDAFGGSCDNLVCVATVDDSEGCGVSSRLTRAVGGGWYYVAVHGYGSAQGHFNLSLTCGVPPPCSGDGNGDKDD